MRVVAFDARTPVPAVAQVHIQRSITIYGADIRPTDDPPLTPRRTERLLSWADLCVGVLGADACIAVTERIPSYIEPRDYAGRARAMLVANPNSTPGDSVRWFVHDRMIYAVGLRQDGVREYFERYAKMGVMVQSLIDPISLWYAFIDRDHAIVDIQPNTVGSILLPLEDQISLITIGDQKSPVGMARSIAQALQEKIASSTFRAIRYTGRSDVYDVLRERLRSLNISIEKLVIPGTHESPPWLGAYAAAVNGARLALTLQA